MQQQQLTPEQQLILKFRELRSLQNRYWKSGRLSTTPSKEREKLLFQCKQLEIEIDIAIERLLAPSHQQSLEL